MNLKSLVNPPWKLLLDAQWEAASILVLGDWILEVDWVPYEALCVVLNPPRVGRRSKRRYAYIWRSCVARDGKVSLGQIHNEWPRVSLERDWPRLALAQRLFETWSLERWPVRLRPLPSLDDYHRILRGMYSAVGLSEMIYRDSPFLAVLPKSRPPTIPFRASAESPAPAGPTDSAQSHRSSDPE